MNKINFYGGPGSGKSTVAALLYSELKVHGYRTELVREFAKDLVYQGLDLRQSDENLQLIIFANQLERELLLRKNVDFIISDSPLFLNAFYANNEFITSLAKKNDHSKDLHIWIDRDPNEKFESSGRSHTENQSLKIDNAMKEFLVKCGINLLVVKGTAKEKSSHIVNKIIREAKRPRKK